jgi:hypothetical protein
MDGLAMRLRKRWRGESDCSGVITTASEPKSK